jgi:hypothetical protein
MLGERSTEAARAAGFAKSSANVPGPPPTTTHACPGGPLGLMTVTDSGILVGCSEDVYSKEQTGSDILIASPSGNGVKRISGDRAREGGVAHVYVLPPVSAGALAQSVNEAAHAVWSASYKGWRGPAPGGQPDADPCLYIQWSQAVEAT